MTGRLGLGSGNVIRLGLCNTARMAFSLKP
jgi:hypothetical protein